MAVESIGTIVMLVISLTLAVAAVIFVIYCLIKMWSDDPGGPK